MNASLTTRKTIYGLLLFGGTLIGISPFLATILTGDASITQNKTLVYTLIGAGIVLILVAGAYARKVFICPHCMQRLTTNQGGTSGTQAGGMIGAFRILKMTKCPECGQELE